ncbi:hypothetical protein GOP47_0021868 [Adiantum capillus-veneris]|uniref:RING-type domain-containing protein n=1 Tax=Adiantum capillus-veneris TaxID=13818 RepID=A0A9D4U886_ADICA|nr:hypothetical protein GOP47_0021868 [Adiantum capillus-veneris]
MKFEGPITAVFVRMHVKRGCSIKKHCEHSRFLNESLKLLEADIQHANTLSLGFPKEDDDVCLQMRLDVGPSFLLCLFSWADCRLVGALGLLRIFIYKVLKDGTTTMCCHERRASLREFYGYILPSLELLEGCGFVKEETHRQKAVCKDEDRQGINSSRAEHHSLTDAERDQECAICLEIVPKVVLPSCGHSLCLECHTKWKQRSASCPFCRGSLEHVSFKDLWFLMDCNEPLDLETYNKDNLRRLFNYVEKLPLVVPNNCSSHGERGP